MDLDRYRRSAEEFVAELTAAYYRHYAGLEESYEIAPVYERHAELFEPGAVEALRDAHASAPPGGEEERRRRMLLDFAVEGYVGQATKASDTELAQHEAQASITVDGETLGFRAATVAQANEPDGDRRAAIEDARLTVIDEQLEPLLRDILERQHAAAGELGFASYRELCETTKGLDLDGLGRATREFLAATEDAYPVLLDPELRRVVGVGLDGARRSDLPRFFRAADDDASFPASRLLDSLLETLRGLGVADEGRVRLDVESRPGKSPRAFCAPLRVPEEVFLVIAPIGGRDDFAALFHEAGHAEHYAHVEPALAFEFRWLGDNAITETFAFLLQHLTDNPLWLERRLGVDPDRAAALGAYGRAHRLVYLRRYAAKLAYELELHGAGRPSFDALADRYSELLGRAFRLPWTRATFLSDVDPGFYSACYLRAWALESHLRAHLVDTFGPGWFEEPQAGAWLRELWSTGQRLTPDELLGEFTGEQLDFSRLLDDVGISAAA